MTIAEIEKRVLQIVRDHWRGANVRDVQISDRLPRYLRGALYKVAIYDANNEEHENLVYVVGEDFWRYDDLTQVDHSRGFSETERVAAAAFIAFVGGVLLPKALFQSLDRALLVWVVVASSAGFTLGRPVRLRILTLLGRSFIVAVFFSLAVSGFMVVRWLVSRAEDPKAPFIAIPFGSGVMTDPTHPIVLIVLGVLVGVCLLGSWLFVFLASLASQPLLAGISRFYRFGPEGIRRVHSLLFALAGVIAAAIVIWAAFDK